MKKIGIIIASVLLTNSLVFSQKYKVAESKVVFFSEALIENITASNTSSAGLFNSENGEIAFVIPIDKFEFEKSLMKEHFNEKYMHTEKYPKASFSGKLSGYNLALKGIQNVQVQGKLTIHGVTKEITVKGTFEKKGNAIQLDAKFPVKLEDYKVERPKLLWENIAEIVEVTVDFNFNKQ